MAQLPVAGPCGEGDLRDEVGFHPVRVAWELTIRLERRVGPFEPFQVGVESPQSRVVEPGVDLAGLAQLVVVPVARQQRAEPLP
nr:hypothetical protein [Frankia sp. QA3]